MKHLILYQQNYQKSFTENKMWFLLHVNHTLENHRRAQNSGFKLRGLTLLFWMLSAIALPAAPTLLKQRPSYLLFPLHNVLPHSSSWSSLAVCPQLYCLNCISLSSIDIQWRLRIITGVSKCLWTGTQDGWLILDITHFFQLRATQI